MIGQEDMLEAGRKAHELSHVYGQRAHLVAKKIAEKALADGDTKEQEFWNAVYHRIAPRG